MIIHVKVNYFLFGKGFLGITKQSELRRNPQEIDFR